MSARQVLIVKVCNGVCFSKWPGTDRSTILSVMMSIYQNAYCGMDSAATKIASMFGRTIQIYCIEYEKVLH